MENVIVISDCTNGLALSLLNNLILTDFAATEELKKRPAKSRIVRQGSVEVKEEISSKFILLCVRQNYC